MGSCKSRCTLTDKAPDLVRELRITWIAIYERAPTAAIVLLAMMPAIVLYAIYTWGSIRNREQANDREVSKGYEKSKKQKNDI